MPFVSERYYHGARRDTAGVTADPAERRGLGLAIAHEVVKEHSLAVAVAQREGRVDDLFARLAADPRLPLGADELAGILSSARHLTGTSGAQVDRFVERVAIVGARHPAASAYRPQAIL